MDTKGVKNIQMTQLRWATLGLEVKTPIINRGIIRNAKGRIEQNLLDEVESNFREERKAIERG